MLWHSHLFIQVPRSQPHATEHLNSSDDLLPTLSYDISLDRFSVDLRKIHITTSQAFQSALADFPPLLFPALSFPCGITLPQPPVLFELQT